MEIRKVKTQSFAISEKKESRMGRDTQRKAVGIFSLGPRKTASDLRKGYFPVIAYKLVRPVQVHKGIARQASYEKKENYFYVNLNNGLIYHYKSGKLHSFDILNMVKDMQPEAVRVLGSIVTGGETLKETLPQGIVLDLLRAGLIKVYKPTLTELITEIVDELTIRTDDGKHMRHTLVKERVDRNFHLPNFDDAGYDLSRFIKTTNKMRDTYLKEPIKCSVDLYADLLKWLFESAAEAEGVYYLPYINCTYEGRMGKRDCFLDYSYPVCEKKETCVAVEDIDVPQIALSTEVGALRTVPVERDTIDYSQVAGLEDVKKEIRESIIYPLTRPELAKEYHRKGGGGILLYGPPGCGKTHIARATIGECGAAFYNINISDLVKKGFEEAAKSLHEIFEHATKNAPAVIFFDELDAVGGKREIRQTQHEKMLIDQLLTEMDGVESMSENILFIGATNSPWSIDPALRRSERFTKQLFVPPPDTKTRLALFRIHAKKDLIGEGVNFEKLSELTDGYSSADIKATCDDAATVPWEKALQDGVDRKVTMLDFISAIKKRPSSLIPWYKSAYRALEESGERDIYKEFSKQIMKYAGGVDAVSKQGTITFEDVGNLEDVKEEIRKSIIYPMQREDLAKEFDQRIDGGILLYGPPGCGKTYIARATAGECKAMFFNVTITDIISPVKGEPEKKIREVFERARINAPSILFFDEIDAFAGRRENLGIEESRIVEGFLTELDGFKKASGVIVMAATNSPWALDPALRRPDRFTKQIYIGPPGTEARKEIFMIHCKGKPLANDVDFDTLVDLTKNYTAADISAVCNAAAEIPWSEALKGRAERKITTYDFLSAIKKIGSSLTPWISEAKRGLGKSGEASVYKELSTLILEYRTPEPKRYIDIVKSEKPEIFVDEETKKLEVEKEDLVAKMKLAQHMYYKREVSETEFRHIIEEYEKELIDLDLQINKKKTLDTKPA
jgi:transitional endoplasmic reticulum ATPase